jgi:malate dehydrogenase
MSTSEERRRTPRKELATLIARHEIDSAYQLMEEISPSTRILVEPFITQTQIHSTPNATANATLELAAAALIADGRRVHGQVSLRGEYHAIHGVCGVPLNLRLSGWEIILQEQLALFEIRQLLGAAAAIETARMEYAAT